MHADQRGNFDYARHRRPLDDGGLQQSATVIPNTFISNGQHDETSNYNSLKSGTLHDRLYEFYSRHQPSIAPRAKVIAKQYQDKEDLLNRNLRQTYGVDLNSDETGTRAPHTDLTSNGDHSMNNKQEGLQHGATTSSLPPQARPISQKQFIALLNRKDIIPRYQSIDDTKPNASNIAPCCCTGSSPWIRSALHLRRAPPHRGVNQNGCEASSCLMFSFLF